MFSANQIVGFFNQTYLKPDFLNVYLNSHTLKVDQKFFRVSMVKNGCGHSGNGSKKMTASQERTGGINWLFLYAG